MFSTRLVFTRHCAFYTQYQNIVSFSTLQQQQQQQQSSTLMEKNPPIPSQHGSVFSDKNKLSQETNHTEDTKSKVNASIDPSKSKEKLGFLERLDLRLSESQTKWEQELLHRHERGEKTKLTPELKKNFDEWNDPQKTLQTRESLLQQAKKGYFDEYKEVVKKGNKFWNALETLIPSNVSLFL